MKKGDRVFYYHTGNEKAVIGTATVTAPAYPDPERQERASSWSWSSRQTRS